MSFAAEGNSLETLYGGTAEAMNQKLFYLLHLAPGKPLQTEEAEKPYQTLGTGARLSCRLHCLQADGGKCSHLPLGQLHPRLLVPCLHTSLFPAASQVSAWPALGLVSSKPTWVVLTWVGLQQPQDVQQCWARSEQQFIRSLSETEFDHTSFICWDVKGKCWLLWGCVLC